MVIPWVGISLADVVKHFQPTSSAKYVAFETLNDPVRMPGQRRRVLEWPYKEGLTIAEATNPLAILAVAFMEKRCRTRMAHQYGSSFPGSMVSRASRASFASALPRNNRRSAGISQQRTSMASMPTLIPRLTIRAGARQVSERLAAVCLHRGNRPGCSMAMANRSPTFTTASICARTSSRR